MLLELARGDYEPVLLPVMWAISNLLLSVDNQNIFEGLAFFNFLVTVSEEMKLVCLFSVLPWNLIFVDIFLCFVDLS